LASQVGSDHDKDPETVLIDELDCVLYEIGHLQFVEKIALFELVVSRERV
jgi:hypothetical protein